MIIKDKIFDEERALYNLQNATVQNCIIDGPADGESAFKECRSITVNDSKLMLRYPLWHCIDLKVNNCYFGETCRAGMWYDDKVLFTDCVIDGIKAFRECKNIKLTDCKAKSPEFGWKCENVDLNGGEYVAEYFLLLSKSIRLKNVKFTGKYSFQYVENVEIDNCVLDTKDAFWHANNVIVRNSVVKGEYLAWYSQNVTFINCKIIGTQPLCYCKNLTLINCETEGCDLAFEYSAVQANIIGKIDSVKNPAYGEIIADEIGEIILEQSIIQNNCKIVSKK